LNLQNNSATNTYKILFNIAFNHAVNAGGANAYAFSEFTVRNPAGGADLFFTQLMSDTLNLTNNSKNGVATNTLGGALNDAGPATFAITLAPGALVSFDPTQHDLFWTLSGGAFTDPGSTASASLDAFLSIAAIENLTTPPNPVPAPATLLLVVLGAAAMRLVRRNASA
jgi:hypothetical protein